MQAPTTWMRSHHISPLTAGALGVALLAALAIGAVTLGNEVELPLLSSSSDTQTSSQMNPRAEQLLVEQNGFDYIAVEPADPLFLEANSWDYQPVANYATVDAIRMIEQNSFDYAMPTTSEQMRFREENAWDYELQAQPTDKAEAESAPDFKFLEENSWDTSQPVLPVDNGSRDY